MNDNLLGSPVVCDPAARIVFQYFPHGTREKLDGKSFNGFGDLVTPPVGTWYWVDPGQSPYIVCPRCKHASRLENYSVDSHGNVHPAISCPMREDSTDGAPKCDANYYGRLSGYMFVEASF